MEITILGKILFFFSVVILIFKKNFFYYFSIFSIPFTATALINFESGFWLSPAHFFAIVLLILNIHILINSLLNIDRYKYIYIFIGFMFFSSIYMPFYIDGDLFIRGTILLEERGPLFLTYKNLTTPMYILLGVLFSILLSKININIKLFNKTIYIYIYSGLFCSIWGLFQFYCNYNEIEYPYYLFNNSANPVAAGYLSILPDLSNPINRITSIATESSVLAQFLLPLLPLFIYSLIYNNYFFSKYLDFISFMLLISCIIISTSSTGYFGLLFLVFLIPLGIYLIDKSKLSKFSILLFIIFFILSLIYILNYEFRNKLSVLVLDKINSGSADERLMTINQSYEYFLSYPLFGIGFGSATSNDLLFLLLSSVGVVGLSFFLISLFKPIFSNIIAIKKGVGVNLPLNFKIKYLSLIISFLLMIFTQSISGFNFGFLYFWFYYGLILIDLNNKRFNNE